MTSVPQRPARSVPAARLLAPLAPLLAPLVAALVALAAAALVLVPVEAGAGPSIPKACGGLDLTDPDAVVENAEGADDVFVGRVVRIEAGATGGDAPLDQQSGTATPTSEPAQPGSTGTAAPQAGVRHEILVEDAVAGDLRPGQPVRVVFVGGDVQLRLNATYVLFTAGEDDPLEADACTGWVSARGLTAARVAELREALAPEEPPSVTFSEPEGGSDGPPELGRVLAPGGAVALVGVLGLVLLSRVGRPRP